MTNGFFERNRNIALGYKSLKSTSVCSSTLGNSGIYFDCTKTTLTFSDAPYTLDLGAVITTNAKIRCQWCGAWGERQSTCTRCGGDTE